MNELTIFVGLKIWDTTAITAFKTVKKMGFDIKKLDRLIYYKFYFDGDKVDFIKRITKVDVLINSNKNNFIFDLEKISGEKLLVKDIGDDCTGLLSILRERLGFSNIKKMEKGILWIIDSDKKTAERAAKELFVNENYQVYEFI